MVNPVEGCLSNEAYLQHLRSIVVRETIPISGSIDLTQRCNLKCVHCYAGPQSAGLRRKELSADEFRRVIDEIAEAGCLLLLMTGGEVLLREDFPEIYRHAKTSGMVVTVFTNGTLVDDRVLELFSDLPPQAVEISLYGATAGTYESITRVKGSYGRCLTGVKLLLEHGVNVWLKTILMTLNRHEFFEMEELAEQLGVRFRFDAAISPRLNGDKSPLSLRVSPEESVEKEFHNRQKVPRWKAFSERYQGVSVSDQVYLCSAGRTSFHVDTYGNLKPCLMTTGVEFSLLHGAFHEGWRKVQATVQGRKADAANPCRECREKALCGYCPPFFQLETGSENVPSEYLCITGRLRSALIHRESGCPKMQCEA